VRHLLIRIAIGATSAAGVVGGLAGAAEAKTVRGTVVHHNARAHSFSVADRAGRLYAIHARRAPKLGARVTVSIRPLLNGTYRLQRVRVSRGATRRVHVRGVVSWVNRRSGEIALSAPGVSMVVRRGSRHAASTADALPSPGTTVVTTGVLDDQGELDEATVQAVGEDATVDLEGTVLAVDQGAGTITVSADDDDQTGSSIVVTVPSTFDITQFTAGEEVELAVQPTGNGTALLVGSSDDESAQAADDQGDEQGDDPGDDAQGTRSDGGGSQGTGSQGGESQGEDAPSSPSSGD
jgi:hypothetical protein